jgi:hypothetical protein
VIPKANGQWPDGASHLDFPRPPHLNWLLVIKITDTLLGADHSFSSQQQVELKAITVSLAD